MYDKIFDYHLYWEKIVEHKQTNNFYLYVCIAISVSIRHDNHHKWLAVESFITNILKFHLNISKTYNTPLQ